MRMEATKETERTIQQLKEVVQEGEQVLKAGDGESGETTRAVRAKLVVAIDKAKALYQKLQDQTVAAAKATDKVVREHPYESIGVAFGIGVLIGVLAARSRRS